MWDGIGMRRPRPGEPALKREHRGSAAASVYMQTAATRAASGRTRILGIGTVASQVVDQIAR
jgi:hypothetical protein